MQNKANMQNKRKTVTKFIGLAFIAIGLFILLRIGYTDVSTSLYQEKLRHEWLSKNNENSSNIASSTTTISSGKNNKATNTSLSKNKKSNIGENSTETANKLNDDPTIKQINKNNKPIKHPKIKLGSAFARIVIPKIKLDAIVVEGVGKEQLDLGPGHMEETAWPGEVGNMVISGHRVTHSRPFYYLDQLEIGDPIHIYTKSQKFTYFVVEKKVVLPTDISVIQPTRNKVLTLTTCNPRFSAKTRLIIHAKMRD